MQGRHGKTKMVIIDRDRVSGRTEGQQKSEAGQLESLLERVTGSERASERTGEGEREGGG